MPSSVTVIESFVRYPIVVSSGLSVYLCALSEVGDARTRGISIDELMSLTIESDYPSKM